MGNGPFQALQSMYLFDPMTGKPKPDADPVLLKIAIQKTANDKMVARLKAMRVQSVNKEPNWENCINVSFKCYDREVVMNVLAGKLVYDNKIPLELAKFENTIFVKTEDTNV